MTRTGSSSADAARLARDLVGEEVTEVAEMTAAWIYDDGGRAAAFFKGDAGDCVTRAIAIATEQPYIDVYERLSELMTTIGKPRSARNGIDPKITRLYFREVGWDWTPTMQVGSGCQVHLRADELPSGRLAVRLSRHLCAVVNGTIRDTHDPSRNGTRCVYGYFSEPVST